MATKSYVVASIYPQDPNSINKEFSNSIFAAEKALDSKILCLIHQGSRNYEAIDGRLYERIALDIRKQPRDKPVTVLLHSPGGDPHSAFKIARLLNRHCGSFSVIVPKYAKSAATLLSLGAKKIHFGECAEFGPLDVQVGDHDRERLVSALEMVQSLERLNSEAMQVMETMLSHLRYTTRKKYDVLLPHVLKYTTDLTRPFFEKIDTVSFTLHSRLLKVGEMYAQKLLEKKYKAQDAITIAMLLTRFYPDHGYVIDREETQNIGLEILDIPDIIPEQFQYNIPFLAKTSVLGFLEEKNEQQAKKHKEKVDSSKKNAEDSTTVYSEESADRNDSPSREGNHGSKT